MENTVKELLDAAQAALLVMPEHPHCQDLEACKTRDTDRCCAGEVTRLRRAIVAVPTIAPSVEIYHMTEEDAKARGMEWTPSGGWARTE